MWARWWFEWPQLPTQGGNGICEKDHWLRREEDNEEKYDGWREMSSDRGRGVRCSSQKWRIVRMDEGSVAWKTERLNSWLVCIVYIEITFAFGSYRYRHQYTISFSARSHLQAQTTTERFAGNRGLMNVPTFKTDTTAAVTRLAKFRIPNWPILASLIAQFFSCGLFSYSPDVCSGIAWRMEVGVLQTALKFHTALVSSTLRHTGVGIWAWRSSGEHVSL